MKKQTTKGQTSKHRPPRLAEGLLRLLASRKNENDLLGDAEEEYRLRRARKGRIKADLWYISQIVFPVPFFMRTSFFWSLAILRNYAKVALRTMRRHKAFTVINTAGLSLGMACFILTVVWALYEFSFDRFHTKGDDLFRVISTTQRLKGPASFASTALPLGQYLDDNYPEVTAFSRYTEGSFYWRLQIGEAVEYNTLRRAYADPGFFDMFDFQLLAGDRSTALVDPFSVVITESMASKYFGTQDPMGKALLFMDSKIPMYVTGVMEDIPENSHMRFDFLVNIRAHELWYGGDKENDIWTDWSRIFYGLYVQLEPGVSAQEFESKISGLITEFVPESKTTLSLQPLKRIHLYSGIISEGRPIGRGDIGTLYLFLFISFMVLLIACINFMSLATARSLTRSQEVGIRKVNGAYRSDIVRQFLGESFLHVSAALIIALFLADLFLPLVGNFTGRDLEWNLLSFWPLVLAVVVITILTGLISGIYPAAFASACHPVQALKDMGESRKYSFLFLRRFLVSVQFVCASVLIIVSFVILSQLGYLNNKDLGYDKRNVAVFSVGSVRKNLDAFKTELRKNPNILHVAAGAAPTWGVGGHRFGEAADDRLSWEGKIGDEIMLMDLHFADCDFQEMFNIEMMDGRWFSREFGEDTRNYVLNEAAVRAMRLADPVGKWFQDGDHQGTIIGVVKDFHTGTLRNKITPTYFRPLANLHVMARIGSQDVMETVAFIEKTWKEFVPERPINLQWLDQQLEDFYSDDRKLGRIVTYYTGLSLLISCLGLLGLVSFLAEQKTKEIGVRKILGAPLVSVIGLMTREYVVILAVSSLIAWPIAYLIASRWLSEFAYNTGINVWIFPAALAAIFLVAFLSVGYKTLKAALQNPIDSLRYE